MLCDCPKSAVHATQIITNILKKGILFPYLSEIAPRIGNIAAAANIEIETVIAYSAELTPPSSRVIHKGKKKDSIAKLNIVFARS